MKPDFWHDDLNTVVPFLSRKDSLTRNKLVIMVIDKVFILITN